MAKKQIRVGVIGLGGIGNFHSMAITQNPDAELVAFYDVVPEAVERAAKAYPTAKGCKSLAEFLDTPGMNAVIIGTSNNVHAKYTIAAAKRGMHVLCEKPLAMNPAEAKKMLNAVRDNGVVGMANFGYRRTPSFKAIREMVRKGVFGKIHRVRAEFLQGWLRDPNANIVWRNQKEFAGFGALGDLGSHMIDSVAYILGAKPKRAIGFHSINVATKINPKTGKKAKVTADTDSQFLIDFGSFVASFETSQVDIANGGGLVIYVGAEKGTFRISSGDGKFYEVALDETGTSANGIGMSRVEVAKELQVDSPFNADFILAIQKKTKDYPNFEDGYMIQKALEAVDRSTKTGKWEKI